jgi:hypothetical protein
MNRALPLMTLMLALGVASPAFAQSQTTRIETRPVYGAIVTYEHGVRVLRALPSEQHVIVNPRGATPLVLGIDSRVAAPSPAYSAPR